MQLGYNNSLVGQNRPRGASFVGALDGFTADLAGAWSVARRLLADYSGPLIRVRRSSDDTELDIGFTEEGLLDADALTTFCGAGNGFIRRVYEQSGMANDAHTSIATEQPKIVDTGSVLLCESLPTAVFDGSNDALPVENLVNTDVAAYAAILRSEGATWNIYGSILGPVENGVGANNATRLGIMSVGTTEFWSDLFPDAVRQNGVNLSSPFSMSDIDTGFAIGVDTATPTEEAAIAFAQTGPIFFLQYRLTELVAWGTVADRSDFELNQQTLLGV